MDKNIIFYNSYHNGDVFYSKEFVKDIQRKVNTNYNYSHFNNTSILKDVNISQNRVQTPPNNITVFHNNNDIYINTWIGQNANYLIHDCSLKSNYILYGDIYKSLNIDIEPIGFYVPEVDFNKVEKENIDNYFNNIKNKTVLVCNNNVHSGQAVNFNFDPIIDNISEKFKDILFIFTNGTFLKKDNITTAKDIIGFDMGNLLEISYMSTKIDTIIGRASGPYCFTHIKDNMNNENKNFIVFCNTEDVGKWVPDSESKAKQHWFNKYDRNYVIDSIDSVLKIN